MKYLVFKLKEGEV